MFCYVTVMYPNISMSNMWSHKVITRYSYSGKINQNCRHSKYKEVIVILKLDEQFKINELKAIPAQY